jgi:lysophospholipid acyltransferase (LPLAT)-like uncharacterized protein
METDSSANPPPPTPPRRKPKSGIVKPHRASFRQRVVARLIWLALRGLALTLRVRLEERSGCFTPERAHQPVIFGIWHNRLALCGFMYSEFVRRQFPGRRLTALVSASRDGGLLARILELFGMEAVRGSSSRRGAQALVEFRRAAARGLDLAITPDGPRGPCYLVQDGAIVAAKVTGLPIVPVSYHAHWKIRLPSWDHFQIPLPFSRVDIRSAPPIRVPAECDEAEIVRLREQLRTALLALAPD